MNELRAIFYDFTFIIFLLFVKITWLISMNSKMLSSSFCRKFVVYRMKELLKTWTTFVKICEYELLLSVKL